MTAKNTIIKAHRRYLREENRTSFSYRRPQRILPEVVTEEVTEFLPTEPCSMAEYCPVPRPFDLRDLIAEAVQKEDWIRSSFYSKKQEIPKMTYPHIKFRPASLKAFISQFMGAIAP